MRLSDHDNWARQHHGLLTLQSSGLSYAAWRRAIRSGSLIAIHPQVARLPGTDPNSIQCIAAAVLAGGFGAMASHRSAARLWGVERPAGDPVDIILGDAKRHIDLDAAWVHRPRDRARLTPQRRAGIPCTNIIRTLCDLGAVAPDGVVDAVRVALDRRLASVAALRAAAEQHARPGRAGIPALREAIDYWEIDRKPADSILELTFTRLCRDHHLPPFSFHELIGRWEVDFRFAGTPLIVECDGWSTHGLDREQFERDRVKDAELTAAGWQVLRLTYRSIVGDAVGTATRLRRALDRWSGTPCPSV